MRRLIIILTLVLLLATPALISACGGFFSARDTELFMNTLRIAFAVDEAQGTVTEVVGLKFEDEPKDFGWIFPVPAEPTLDVTDYSFLDELGANTTVDFVNRPVNYCAQLFSLTGGAGGGGGPMGTLGEVGPYEYAVVKGTQPAPMVQWLRDNGYKVDASDEATIAQYVREGNVFVALRLKPEAGIQDIQPIVLKYRSRRITIPVRMGASSSDAVSILAWVFGNTQYISQNYRKLVLSETLPYFKDVRNSVAAMGFPRGYRGYEYDPYLDAYHVGRLQLLKRYGGHALFTEYAGKLANFAQQYPDQIQSSLLHDFAHRYRYITRFSGYLTPSQMNLDPMFIPTSSASDETGTIDLGPVVDPIFADGCATQTGIKPEVVREFATSHRIFREMNADIAYPPGWILSTFAVQSPTLVLEKQFQDEYNTAQERQVYVYSPESVTAQSVYDWFLGKPTPPMLVFVPLKQNGADGWDSLYVRSGTYMAQSTGCDFTAPETLFAQILSVPKCTLPQDEIDFWMHSSMSPSQYGRVTSGVFFALLTSRADTNKNSQLYRDMLAYTGAHQYFARDDMRHTLFLTANYGDLSPTVFAIPIPDGWEAHIATWPNRDVIIAPIGSKPDDAGPRMRLTPVGTLGWTARELFWETAKPGDAHLSTMATYLTGLYGDLNGKEALLNALTTCSADVPTALPFQKSDRMGQVVITNMYAASVSVAVKDSAQYAATLNILLDVFRAGYHCQSGR